MKANLRSTISILLIALALIGSAVIWYRFFTSKPSEPVSRLAPEAAAVGPKALLALLETLEGLDLDLNFLNDPVYKSLQDFTPQILLPESKGRNNPFAPF